MNLPDALRDNGFVIIPQFFDAGPLAAEIDEVMRRAFASDRVTDFGGIHFQYVPMMTAETPVSLALLDRIGLLAESLLSGPVIPTRAKGTRYFGSSPWHRDSELPLTSIGFLAYFESLTAENGALRVRPGSHHRESFDEQVIETEPGDVIVLDEHLFHASERGGIRRQWRVDYLRVPANADEERETRSYFEGIYPPDWDGGYDVHRYPSYGPDWRKSARQCVAQLEKLGVYDLAIIQERFHETRTGRGV